MKTTSFIAVFVLPFIAAQIPYVTHIYNVSSGTLYRFHRECRTYEKAKWFCEEEGGHLVIINSDQEAEHLGTLFQQNHPDLLDCEAEIYVGVHFDEALGEFRTLEGYLYSRETDSLYKFHEQQVTRAEARSICSSQGAHLAAIANEVEAHAVSVLFRRLFVKYQTVALVGLHYASARPASSITYNEENAIERNDIPIFILTSEQRGCNAINLYGGLVKEDCSNKNFFICEMDRQTSPAKGFRHTV